MGYDLDLKRRCELAGLTVTEIDEWWERGSPIFDPVGSLDHHTAGAPVGVQPSLGVCINGRGGSKPLAGPLCNTHGPREESLRINLVAAGRANHGGAGVWRGVSGNSRFYGHEEEHVGTTAEPLSPLRYDRMVRVHAAFAFGNFNASMVAQHWEYATPPGRKIDFVKAWVAPEPFRVAVAARLQIMADQVRPPSQEDPVTHWHFAKSTDTADPRLFLIKNDHGEAQYLTAQRRKDLTYINDMADDDDKFLKSSKIETYSPGFIEDMIKSLGVPNVPALVESPST